MAEILQGKLVAAYGMETTIPVLKLMEERDADLQMLGRYVYDNVFLNYTVKQWTLRPEQLDPHVTARVPVRISEDDRYFRDVHQAMPVNGYTHIFAAMLEHPNIRVEAGADYRAQPIAAPRAHGIHRADRRIFRLRLWAFAVSQHPLRGADAGTRVLSGGRHRQLSGGPGNDPHHRTKAAEQRKLTVHHDLREYPQAYLAGENEPYYPVPTKESEEAISPYRAQARQLSGRVWFAGRLGDFQYYNMDQACARGHALVDKEIACASKSHAAGETPPQA